ncbi:uncharacterized protein LOC107022147 [Solanum pennellii]|uniref:Uncharacterized protein LOC107022147 n=1 Tax=Solanum pennellii TaxID=28526 RepID=A0ABM1GZU5_SOLPN|nr:uncharacterized protein LOC107022147 [Solanum pennellii]
MSHFVTSVSEELEEEYRAAMLHDNMDISRLIVHAQQVEESRLRAKSFESGSSKSRLDVQDKPKFKKGGSNPKPRKGRNVVPPKERPTCGKCGKKHVGECLVGTNSSYGCGNGGHMVKDCPYLRRQGKENGQAQPSGPSSDAPKRNRFYALKPRGEQEISPDVVTGATLYFVTHLVARKFDVIPDVFIAPFLICIPMADSVVAKRV